MSTITNGYNSARDWAAKQVADNFWQEYMDEVREAQNVDDILNAWNTHQRKLRARGIVATLAGYRYAKDLSRNKRGLGLL